MPGSHEPVIAQVTDPSIEGVFLRRWVPGFNGTTVRVMDVKMEEAALERLEVFFLAHWDITIAPLLKVSVAACHGAERSPYFSLFHVP